MLVGTSTEHGTSRIATDAHTAAENRTPLRSDGYGSSGSSFCGDVSELDVPDRNLPLVDDVFVYGRRPLRSGYQRMLNVSPSLVAHAAGDALLLRDRA